MPFLTLETAAHYLYFSSEEVKDGDTRFKTCPPIRNANNKDLLWMNLKEGFINCISSHHNPIPDEYKDLGGKNFKKALPGVNSIGFTL